jgi:hypothetical protein
MRPNTKHVIKGTPQGFGVGYQFGGTATSRGFFVKKDGFASELRL